MKSRFPKEENQSGGEYFKIDLDNQKKLTQKDKDLLWSKIDASLNKKKKFAFLISFSKIAASLSLLLITGISIWYLIKEEISPMATIVENVHIEDNSDIQLLLSEDRTLAISNDESSIVYKEDGKIDIDSLEDIELYEELSAYNTLIVPYGKRSNLTLKDGTKVWINSGSKLVYPTTFSPSERRVFVEGEAYFEVTRNDKSPFIVETKNLDIRVLGTSFNVTAFRDEPTFSTVLVHGSVEVTGNKNSRIRKTKTILTPNDRLAYHAASGETMVKKVNVERYVSWKDGYLIYRQASLKNVMKQLSRLYNIEVVFSDPTIEQEKLTGKLDLKQNADEVISIISSASSLTYQKTERRYILSYKQP